MQYDKLDNSIKKIIADFAPQGVKPREIFELLETRKNELGKFQVERMKERDPDYWRVYGEGQRAVFSKRQIFSNWNFELSYNEFPELENVSLGIDFGFTNDPTAICLVGKRKDKLYVHELMYSTGKTNQDIANFLKANNLNDTLSFADSAEPKSIMELRQMGCLVKEAKKGQRIVNI